MIYLKRQLKEDNMNYSELVEKVQKYYEGATANINEDHVAIEFQVEG